MSALPHSDTKLTYAPLIVSFGAGDNSGAMLLGMYERGIRPDAILFADTGGEKPDTYHFVWTFTRWLIEHGFPAVTVVIKGGRVETLEADCVRIGALPSIVYGMRTCSQKYKIEPCEKWINHWPLAQGIKILNAKGIHAGEQHRAKDYANPKYQTCYPLIEWNWGKEECLEAFARHGLEAPGKSACFFCPSSKKREVLWLKDNHPDLYARAVAMERNALEVSTDRLRRAVEQWHRQQRDGSYDETEPLPNLTVRGLGRHWSWEDLGAADDAQMKMFAEPPEIPCVCADGEVAA